MTEREHTEPIRLFLDDDSEPFKVSAPPLTFQFNTIALPDGPHRLRIEAPNGLAPPTIKEIPFVVRNGVAITASGLEPNQTIAGQVQMVINAYAGSTEVDFEPRRAETPQPIPTWAWVVFLAVVAWTMYYLVTPQIRSSAATTSVQHPSLYLGERIFADACARCHGEEGEGQRPKIPMLRDAPIALEDSPAELLIRVTSSTQGSMMPEWGTRLTNEEIVSVVNHVRASWGHDASRIELSHRNPPAGIDELHAVLESALKQRNLDGVLRCCGETTRITPQIFRTDGVDQRGMAGVRMAWANYLAALDDAKAKVTELSLPSARYDYDPATVNEPGSVVIATGRIFLATENEAGVSARAKGRFIRVYERLSAGWALVFDFADVPMAIGCVPGTVICPPGEEPSEVALVPPSPPPSAAPGSTTSSPIGYAEVQALLRGLKKGAPSAPHETFWDYDYEDFLSFTFPPDFGEDGIIRVVVPGDAKASNLIRALRGGKEVIVEYEGGRRETIDVGRMPKGGPTLPEEDLKRIEAWIDAGCPELAGGAAAAAPPPVAPTPSPAPSPEAPPDPFPVPVPVPVPVPPPPPTSTPAGFPAPAPAPAGFPTPAPAPAPPPAPVPTKVIGFAEVQAMLRGVGAKAEGTPHGAFWELPYREFVNVSFPVSLDRAGTVRLLVPGNAKASNLVRALRGGRDVVVVLPNGRRATRDVGPLHEELPKLTDADLARLEAWIDAGCPEHGAE